MAQSIALTAGQRSALLTLQNVQDLSERTQTRLSTGRKINSVVDDAVNFFKAKSLTDRAEDFNLKKDGIDQGISSISAALDAIEAIDTLVKQMKGIVEAARSQSTSERATATTQFDELGKQIFQLVEDASYQGLNLLNNTSSKLEVSFSTRSASELEVAGFALNATDVTGGGPSVSTLATRIFSVVAFSGSGAFAFSNFGAQASFTAFGANNSAVSLSSTVVTILDNAVSRLRSQAAKLGTNVAILETRLDFTKSYVNTVAGGADKLTLADLNEEGANLIALQTRQQLGIQSLSIAGQQQQAILALIQ